MREYNQYILNILHDTSKIWEAACNFTYKCFKVSWSFLNQILALSSVQILLSTKHSLVINHFSYILLA